MTGILLNALVPIFVVMGIGYFAGWIRDVDNRHVAELNALVMDFALPCALFVATATTLRSVVLAQWPLLLVLVVGMLLLYAVCYWMQRQLFGLDSKASAVQTLTICLPNYAAVGLPLIPAVLGGHAHLLRRAGNCIRLYLSLTAYFIHFGSDQIGRTEEN